MLPPLAAPENLDLTAMILIYNSLLPPWHLPGGLAIWLGLGWQHWANTPPMMNGFEACGGSLAGPVQCDVRDRSHSPPEHTAGDTPEPWGRPRRLGCSCGRVSLVECCSLSSMQSEL